MSYITAMCDECDDVQYILYLMILTVNLGQDFILCSMQSFAADNNLCLSDSSHAVGGLTPLPGS